MIRTLAACLGLALAGHAGAGTLDFADPAATDANIVTAIDVPPRASASRSRSMRGSMAVPLETLGVALAAWVAQAMAVPLPGELPRIAFAAPKDMRARRSSTESTTEALQPLDVVALYDDAGQVVRLPAGWTGASAAELSVLAHEMVHHVQNVQGRRFACPAEREAEAYEIQQRWLEQFGTDLEAEFEINRVTLFVLTRCGI